MTYDSMKTFVPSRIQNAPIRKNNSFCMIKIADVFFMSKSSFPLITSHHDHYQYDENGI